MPDAEIIELVEAARGARRFAYAPYSRFPVGAAVRCRSGEIITGVNVENASYGLSICAERAAVAQAVSQGHQRFRAIAIVTGGPTPPLPCGACCQFLAEFCDPAFPLYLASEEGEPEVRRLGELLPSPFTLMRE